MKIGFVAPVNAEKDLRHFSGTTHHLYRALAKHGDVVPLQVESDGCSRLMTAYYRIQSTLGRGRYNISLHPGVLRRLAQKTEQIAVRSRVDLVLALGQANLAYWSGNIPAVFFSDTIYGTKIDFYSNWQRAKLHSKQINQLAHLCDRSCQNSKLIFTSSRFAIDNAREKLPIHVPENKVRITLIGANFDDPPKSIDMPTTCPPLKLLWVGVDWKRKGGDICLSVTKELNRHGIPTELHVVGCNPPISSPLMKIYGFLRKSDPKENQKLHSAYRNCHLFLFPSCADLTPCSLAEAAAFGLPSVTTRVGGIPEMFPNGEAILLSPEEFEQKAPETISTLIKSGELGEMRQKARHRFETHLNWDTIAKKILQDLSTGESP